MILSLVSVDLPDEFAIVIPLYAPISLIAEQLEGECTRHVLLDFSHASVDGCFFFLFRNVSFLLLSWWHIYKSPDPLHDKRPWHTVGPCVPVIHPSFCKLLVSPR